MKIACIDIAGEVLASLLPVLATAGLTIGGSLDRGEPTEITPGPVVRLVVLDDAGSVLPDECEQGFDRPGLPIVTAIIRQEMRSGFRVVRLGSVEVAGYLTRDRTIIYPDRPVDPDITKALAEARSCPT
ncbi:hypothetical protein [Bradyrhizobium sp. HKCCYLR1051]|uniref:hypothetical protein n=1 Tax=Bradyrhizobium sp. HKCCYLR1051 TaxID=3420738 RepID=UPI003EBB8CF1